MSLFDFAQRETARPLADRMRPRTMDQFLGQEHLVGPGKLLRRAIQAVCEGRDPGDLTTMEDPTALEQVKNLASN